MANNVAGSMVLGGLLVAAFYNFGHDSFMQTEYDNAAIAYKQDAYNNFSDLMRKEGESKIRIAFRNRLSSGDNIPQQQEGKVALAAGFNGFAHSLHDPIESAGNVGKDALVCAVHENVTVAGHVQRGGIVSSMSGTVTVKGNVEEGSFVGSLHSDVEIQGNVASGATIVSTGGKITVHGVVEPGASLLTGGMSGKGADCRKLDEMIFEADRKAYQAYYTRVTKAVESYKHYNKLAKQEGAADPALAYTRLGL